MKKFLPARLKTAKKQPSIDDRPKNPEQVTSDTVNKHRDEVLNKGRKFKYPFQHSKHRVAITSVAVVAASDGLLSPFTRFDSPNDRDGLMRMIELMLSGQIQQVIPAVRKEALRTRLMEGKLQREKMHDDILVCFLDMVGKAGLEEVLKKGLSWGMF